MAVKRARNINYRYHEQVHKGKKSFLALKIKWTDERLFVGDLPKDETGT